MTGKILAMLGAWFLGACVFVGAATNSEPYLPPDSTVRLDDRGLLHYDRMSVSIVPENELPIIGGIGLVLPILPIPGSNEPYRTDQPFQVVIKFDTEITGFTFTPSETEIHFNDEIFAAVRATPLATRRYGSGGMKWTLPGHRWSCWTSPEDFDSSEIDEAISLARGCVFLEFSVDTIHPSESFAVNLGGLRFLGEPLPAVEVQFRHDTRGMVVLGIQ